MAMVVIGVVLLGVAALLVYLRRGQIRKMAAMTGQQTSSCKDVADLYAAVRREAEAGYYAEPVEVKGRAGAAEPLISEIGKTPCVYYKATVTREYEEREAYKDSAGTTQQRMARRSENVSTNSRRLPFTVEDGTGAIPVDPTGAEIVAHKQTDRFEREDGPDGVVEHVAAALGSRRTLGYRHVEEVVPLGQPLYLLAEATDRGGSLVLAKPAAEGRRFLISVKAEEELVSGARSGATWLQWSAVGAGAIGVALILIGVVAAVT